jgi:hypothetical protein
VQAGGYIQHMNGVLGVGYCAVLPMHTQDFSYICGSTCHYHACSPSYPLMTDNALPEQPIIHLTVQKKFVSTQTASSQSSFKDSSSSTTSTTFSYHPATNPSHSRFFTANPLATNTAS